MTATYLFAEMVQNKSAELIQMMIYGVTWIVEPFVPVFSYITDVAVDLYFGFLHGKSTLLRIEFPLHKLAWQQRERSFHFSLSAELDLSLLSIISYFLLHGPYDAIYRG